jgi:putative ABC transport system ATP-binding protein
MNDAGIQQLLQDEIGIVFQFFNLIPSLTAEGNVELPMTIAGRSNKYKKKRIDELLKKVGMDHRKHHRPFTLSGGEKQRIAICMAFANNPQVILADEPTGNVDSVSAQHVLQIFKDFIKENPKKSIVIVTHDPALRRMADRTLIIKDGQIIRDLGKDTLEEDIEEKGEEDVENVGQIYEMATMKDEVKEILNPTKRAKEFEDIKTCPFCGSEHFLKKYDQTEGVFRDNNGQLVTRAAIYCEECHQFDFITVGIMDMTQE